MIARKTVAPLLLALAAISLVVGPIADASTVINGNSTPNFVSASFGATPATVGAIRLSNNTGIYERNVANSLDVPLIALDNLNSLSIGSAAGVTGATNFIVGSTLNITSGAGQNMAITSGNCSTCVLGIQGGNGTPGTSNGVLMQTSNIVWQFNQTTPYIGQVILASTSAGSGANGSTFTLKAQAGQNATGTSNNGGNGGILALSGGIAGTSGSATAGTAGPVEILGPEFNADSGSAIAIGAGGTFTLTSVQYGFTSIALTGSLGANNAIVVLPNVQQRYEFDLSGLTSSTGTLQFKNAGGAVCTSPAVGAAIANSLAVVVTNVTAVNKIACNY